MDDGTARVFSGLGVLVVVWIVVYWSWPAGRGEAPTTGPDEFVAVEAVEPAVLDPVAADPGPVGGVAADIGRGVASPPPPAVVEPAAAPVDSGVIPPEFRDYEVRAGDNFDRISQRVYGTTRHAMAIARSNPLLDPRKLRVGQLIRVPVDPGNIQGKPVGVEPGGEAPAKPAAAPVIEYTVKSGDTLSSIAKSFYGSVRYVDFLYESNRDRLRSPDDLKLGQVLRVPPSPDGAGGG
jgi:nucleoid-associated protein YgaU